MTTVGIVGSGHTAIAVAKVLVGRGVHPIILDVGETLDADRQAVVSRMSGQRKTEWSAEDLAVVTHNPTVSQKKVLRLAFGSEYPYAGTRPSAPLDVVEDGPSPSMARGGYSTIWGAAMLPAASCDLQAWPFPARDLDQYYKLVLRGLPFSATNDALARQFPLYRDDTQPLTPSPIVQSFLRTLDSSTFLRGRDDVAYGQARIAVRTEDGLDGPGCIYCGRCLSGCVYGSIYSAEQDLQKLIRAGQVEYRPGRTVIEFSERGNEVEVLCDTSGGPERVVVNRLFVAAGALNSTRLVLESKRLYDRPTVLRTTQGFVVPMVNVRGAPFEWPNANTLSGAFFEFKHPSLSDNWIHSQISPANELILAKLGYQASSGLFDNVRKLALRRLLIALVNFHSDLAGSYSLRLRAGVTSGRSVLSVTTQPSKYFAETMKKGSRRFTRLLSRVGVVPVTPFMYGDPLKPIGWHFGGTLPMRKAPSDEMHTDLLGRPKGWQQIHVVDSSIFPSVPATTVALLAMANASRIAQTTPLEN
ncbi:GMC oxidoreductase [Mycobacterium sp. TY815]|uniref:GMC oxidoreductase n=1 Tax=Mycobacterium sp. TY815 TaxID=3050581 RepID=UPI0027426913|nr:GMC oxidoreductase [Mycobacterium sp. TY815]MDP7702393.1 GMC oxidoreductase [Mycobacterium sp. TY815]